MYQCLDGLRWLKFQKLLQKCIFGLKHKNFISKDSFCKNIFCHIYEYDIEVKSFYHALKHVVLESPTLLLVCLWAQEVSNVRGRAELTKKDFDSRENFDFYSFWFAIQLDFIHFHSVWFWFVANHDSPANQKSKVGESLFTHCRIIGWFHFESKAKLSKWIANQADPSPGARWKINGMFLNRFAKINLSPWPELESNLITFPWFRSKYAA